MNTIRKSCVYITVFLTSMAGATVGGISLTKIAFIPLMVALVTELKFKKVIYKPEKKLLLYYVVIILSSLWGLIKQKLFVFDTYENKLIMNIVQFLIIYIPICRMLSGSRNISEYSRWFREAIVALAKVNCVWGMVQFAFWSFAGIDFNQLVFTDILHGVFGTQWTVYNQSVSTGVLIRNLRVAGLNFEPACFSFVLLLGYIMDEKKWHKILYVFVIILSLSRAGIVVACCIILLDFIKTSRRLKKATLQRVTIGACGGMIFLVLISKLTIFDNIKNQFQVLLERFLMIGSASAGDGTYRHIMYFFWALRSWILDLGPIQKIIGVGHRVSGVVFSSNASMQALLQESMLNRAWAIENDFADVLLGTGIIGICLLYSFWYCIYRVCSEKIKRVIQMLIIFGLLYNVSIWTFTNLIFLYLITEYIVTLKEDKRYMTSHKNYC